MDLSIHYVSVDRRSLQLARLSVGRRRSQLTTRQARALAREPFIEEYEAGDLIAHLTGFSSVGKPAIEALTGAAPLELCMRPRWGIAPGAGGFSTASLALSLLRLAELGVPCDPAPVVLTVKKRTQKLALLTEHETDVTFWRPSHRIPPVVAFTWPADAHDHDLLPGDRARLSAVKLHDGRVAVAFRNLETRAITEVIGKPSSPKLQKALLHLNCAAAISASSGEVRCAIDRALAETKTRAAERKSAAKERRGVGGWAAAREALH